MRIGLIIYGSLETQSGGYLYDRKLVAHLREQGDEVVILSQPWVNYGRHVLQNTDAKFARHITAQRFDVLLQDELNHPSLFLMNQRLRGRLGGCPIISIVHHLRCNEVWPRWQTALYRWVERRYLNSVNGFIFNSHTTRQSVFGLMGHEAPHVVALPAGDRFGPQLQTASLGLTPTVGHEPLQLLFVGNLISRKGLHVLLAALARCQCTWQLSVVGNPNVDPQYTATLHQQAAALSLSDRVRWLGSLSDEDLAQAFRQHQVLVGPSSYEGFGISYLEAMGFGLPVIATTAGAVPEIVSDGVDGFLVAPDDIGALAARIDALGQDRARLQEMGTAARQRYLCHPTWAQSMAEIKRFLYASILS